MPIDHRPGIFKYSRRAQEGRYRERERDRERERERVRDRAESLKF